MTALYRVLVTWFSVALLLTLSELCHSEPLTANSNWRVIDAISVLVYGGLVAWIVWVWK